RPAAHAGAGGDGRRQAEDDHLLVRRVLHSRLRAGPVRVLPEGHGPGPARPGRHSMSPYNYTAQQVAVDGIDTVQLADAVSQMELRIVPGVGNMAYQWNVGGRNYLHFPYTGLAERARRGCAACRFWGRGPTAWMPKLTGPTASATCSIRTWATCGATAIGNPSTECWASRRRGNWWRPGRTGRVRGPPAGWNSGGIRR